MGLSFSINGGTKPSHTNSVLNAAHSKLLRVIPRVYVQDVVIIDDDISFVNLSWDMVMSQHSTAPFRLKAKEIGFNYTSVLTWFYDALYNRFFELCPEAKPLFHRVSMVNQGRLIAGVISSAIYSLKQRQKLVDKLSKNTEAHSGKGIKSEWYSKMGEALIWALEEVIGDPFDAATRLAWERVYSFMLSIILPIAVKVRFQCFLIRVVTQYILFYLAVRS